jgi:transcriptional regulator with XRE-family HTH domain
MMDIHTRIAHRVRDLRGANGLSLDALAERSKVGRSTISLIERAESSPTAVVLDKLAAALGVTLASLFEEADAASTPPSPIAHAADQPVWTDPVSCYVRRNLSPALPSPIQLVEVNFPAGQHLAYEGVPRDADTHQQVWLIEGVMDITVDQDTWRLEAGDCLAMRLDCPIAYRNPGKHSARYLVALATYPFMPTRRPG